MIDALDRLGWLQRQMEEFWNGAAPSTGALPPLNIAEDADRFLVEAELPGYKLDDLDLSVSGAELWIRGKRGFDAKEGWTVHRRERAAGEFSRSLTLPAEVDADQVKAELKDGVLTVTLPKAPTAKPRKITVKAKDVR